MKHSEPNYSQLLTKTAEMVFLKRIHIVEVLWYDEIETEKVQNMLEEAMGRRVCLDEIEITISEESIMVRHQEVPRGSQKRLRD